MSQPYYGPDEPEDTINLERFFLAGDFVTGFGYGIFGLLRFVDAANERL